MLLRGTLGKNTNDIRQNSSHSRANSNYVNGISLSSIHISRAATRKHSANIPCSKISYAPALVKHTPHHRSLSPAITTADPEMKIHIRFCTEWVTRASYRVSVRDHQIKVFVSVRREGDDAILTNGQERQFNLVKTYYCRRISCQ